MIERRVTIGTPVGLHARPASKFVAKVNALPIDITIGKTGGEAVDAGSIMSVMALDIAGGEEVVIASTSTDADAEAILDELTTYLSADLDAPASS